MGEAMAPIAVVICFGLLYGTGLILIAIPAILSLIDGPGQRASETKTLTAQQKQPA